MSRFTDTISFSNLETSIFYSRKHESRHNGSGLENDHLAEARRSGSVKKQKI